MLCDDLDRGGGVGGGRSTREGIDGYAQLIHFLVQQKLTQSGKATITQFETMFGLFSSVSYVKYICSE